MRRLKVTTLHRDDDRTVVLIETLEVWQHRGSAFFLLASLEPLAVVISGPDGAKAVGLDGNPTELGAEARTLLEDIS